MFGVCHGVGHMRDATLDRPGLQQVLVEVYPALIRFASVVAPREVAPEDLVHDALVAVLRRGSLSDLDDPVAYLRRSIVDLASNQRRRLGRGRRAAVRVGPAELSRSDNYPSDLAHLARLKPAERAVLYLHHVEGHTFESIAEQLHCRPSSVRQLATRARRALRTEIEETT